MMTPDEMQYKILKASINKNKLINPIIVYRIGNRYKVIHGQQRLEAMGDLLYKKIPCRIYGEGDKTVQIDIKLIDFRDKI